LYLNVPDDRRPALTVIIPAVERFFLNPWALAFSALAAGIVLLYILKLRRVKVQVSSTLLWDRAVQDFKANAPWQRLRRNLLMILQIIALILLAFALARPFIFGTALVGGRTVLLIDTSASMLARDVRPDRLGQALDAAGGLVGDFARNDEGMVIAAGPTPKILASFTSNKGELQEALAMARETAGGVADLDAALGLVSSVAQGSSTRVVIFSDGAVPDLDPFATTDLHIEFFPLGLAGENVAIIGAGARHNPFTDVYELFVALHNYYGAPQQLDLTLSVGEDVLDVRTVELEAGRRQEVVLTSLPYIPDPVRVELDLLDPLAADNVAWIVMPRQTSYNVALCTAGESLLLREALRSLDSVNLYAYDGAVLRGDATGSDGSVDIDVWVVEGNAPSGIDPTASYLFIDTQQHAFLPVVPSTRAVLDFTADPAVFLNIVGLDRGHRVLRFVSIGDIRLQAMRRNQLQPWARMVVEASEGPLIVDGNLEGQRTLYLAFDIYESDFPLRAAFPMFLANAIGYLGEASAGYAGQSTAAGTLVDLVAPLEASQVEVTDPAGRESTIELGTREFTLADTTRIGIYQLAFSAPDGEVIDRVELPVSLVNESESNIAPAGTIRVRGVEEALAAGTASREIAGSREVRTNREFFTWLLIAVLLIIGIEWYLYHTRAL